MFAINCAVLRSWKPYVTRSLTHSPPPASASDGPDTPPPFSVDIDYDGTKMQLDFMCGSRLYCLDGNDTDTDTDKSKKKHFAVHNKVYHYFYSEDIPLWFNVKKYVLLTRRNGKCNGVVDGHGHGHGRGRGRGRGGIDTYSLLVSITSHCVYLGSILGESERRLMFSALIGALDASQVQVPAFVSASPSSSVKQSLEVLGYMIMSPRLAEIALQSHDSLVTSGPKVIHFESQTLSNVGSKHPFFYLDGLMRLFATKLWKFSHGKK